MSNLTEEALQRQVEYGLPGEPLHDLRMTFALEPPVLLLQLSLDRLGTRVPQLFLRAEGSHKYVNILEMIGPALDNVTRPKAQGLLRGVRTPFRSPLGVLYFLLVEHRHAGGHKFGHISSVVRFELSSNRTEVWDPSSSDTEACMPTDLLGADEDGIFAKAAFKIPAHADTAFGYSVEYHLVRLDWADRVIKRILALPAIFY
jgi:hypothetical protein